MSYFQPVSVVAAALDNRETESCTGIEALFAAEAETGRVYTRINSDGSREIDCGDYDGTGTPLVAAAITALAVPATAITDIARNRANRSAAWQWSNARDFQTRADRCLPGSEAAAFNTAEADRWTGLYSNNLLKFK